MSTSTMEGLKTIEALQANPRQSLHQVSVEESEVAVILRGDVASYYLKQLAQETIRPYLDGRTLYNRIVVHGEHSLRDEGLRQG